MRESIDIDNPVSAKSVVSEGSVDLMKNIHFAELGAVDIQLSDASKSEGQEDFMPHAFNVNDLGGDHSSEKSQGNSEVFGQNVRYYHSQNSHTHSNYSNSSVSNLHHDSSVNDKSDFEDISENIQSDIVNMSEKEENRKSNQSNEDSEYSSDLSTLRETDHSNGRVKDSDVDSKRHSLTKDKSYTSSSRSSSKKSKHSRGTKSSLSTKADSISISSKSSISSNESYRTYSNETSSKSNSSRQSSRGDKRQTKNTKRGKVSKNAATQICQEDLNEKDPTTGVLNFRHTWDFPQASSIASKVVDPCSIDILSSYSPAVLAVNDMLKFHLHLLRNHIDHSRRLYESYASKNINSNYKYETVENTMKYIEKNRPKVITYEQALQDIQENSG